MKEIPLYPDKITELLIQNLNDTNTVFVFSTDTVMNTWVEDLITHPQKSGTEALPLERFIAWDNFKTNYVHAEQKDYTAIPSILRKLFVQNLISENAKLPKEQRFKVIINPDDEYAQNASSFADWICTNLPGLDFWKQRLDENATEYGEMDLEDKDYLTLYTKYKNFMEENHLFEPSWIKITDISNTKKKFIILYPELLEDFADYKSVFETSENITVCTMPQDVSSPEAYAYTDSRCELRQTMLRIIKLVTETKTDWSEIALSIPNLDVYKPYLEREFEIYNIPYVIKAGVSLTKNNAGKIFHEINECHLKNFTFDSVRSLILDECIPWKEKFESLRHDLVRVGNEMRCICSPEDKDIWFKAFSLKIRGLNDYLSTFKENCDEKNETEQQIDYYTELESFYGKLKHHVNAFFDENTNFETIGKAWQSFKSYFLEDNSQFSTQANNILSRCITELNAISEIEKQYKYCNLVVSNPYEFFLNEIASKKYTPQQKEKSGVNIFSYKLSGPACFKYQFVLDASQKNLDIPHKRLTFLNTTKRKKLHLIEDDKQLRASEVFIKLYAKNAPDNHITFSTAKETFSGFAIPHNCLSIKEPPMFDEEDYILQEKNYLLNPADSPKPKKLTPSQKKEFENWKYLSSKTTERKYKINAKIRENINTVLIEKRNIKSETKTENLKITARKDLENFFPCPRKWLFKSVLKFHDDTLDTELMQNYDMGNLNHKILELFISDFMNKPLPSWNKDTDSFENFELNLMPYVEKSILAPSDFRYSPLVIKALQDQKEKICSEMTLFIKNLFLPFGKPDEKGEVKSIGGIGNCTVKGCEITMHTPGEKFDYYGKIDCLLLSPANDWIIIDYKNSGSSIPAKKNIKPNDNGLLGDFQMPLYFKLIGEQTRHEIAAGYFYSIKDHKAVAAVDKFIIKKDKQTDSFEQFDGAMKAVEKYCDAFYQAVIKSDTEIDFNPYSSNSPSDKNNVSVYSDCVKCSFKQICRTTYTIGGKSIERK